MKGLPLGTQEIDYLVKCLSHEDSFNPQDPCSVTLVIPVLWRWRQADSWDSLASQPSLTGELKTSEILSQRKIRVNLMYTELTPVQEEGKAGRFP